jgi:hypothetical protein
MGKKVYFYYDCGLKKRSAGTYLRLYYGSLWKDKVHTMEFNDLDVHFQEHIPSITGRHTIFVNS